MLDARNIYRKVTRKIYDFSPEQEQNLLAIVWLYRGHTEKYLDLVAGYCRRMLDEGEGCFTARDDDGKTIEPLPSFIATLEALREAVRPFLSTLPGNAPHAGVLKELEDAMPAFKGDVERFRNAVSGQRTAWQGQKTTNGELKKAVDRLAPLAECSRDMIKQSDCSTSSPAASLRPARTSATPGQRRVGRPRDHPPARVPTRPDRWPSSSSSRCVISGGRRTG